MASRMRAPLFSASTERFGTRFAHANRMFGFLKQVAREFSEDDCPRMAAALAYYTAFSLAPLMILLVLLAGVFFDPQDVEGRIESQVASVVGDDGAMQIKETLRNASKPDAGSVAGILSAVALLFGASGVVMQLQKALNDAWEVKPDPEQGGIWNFVTKRLFSFGMILGLAFILIVSLALSTVISALDSQLVAILPGQLGEGAASAVDITLSLVVLTLLFAAIFKVLPDAQVKWKDVLIGALITAVLFVVGKFAMGMYLGSKNMETTFGAAGSLALILLWVYYSGMVLLFGAEFTQVWAKRRGGGITPEAGAIKVKE
jgi:membrane protein